MAKKKRKMSSRGRLIILGPICFVLVVCLIFTIFSYATNLYHLKQEKRKLEANLLELQQTADDLKTEITKLHDPEYLAKFARENYLYSKEGELIIKINGQQEKIAAKEENLEWNEQMITYSLGALGIVFLYIILKGTKKKKSA